MEAEDDGGGRVFELEKNRKKEQERRRREEFFKGGDWRIEGGRDGGWRCGGTRGNNRESFELQRKIERKSKGREGGMNLFIDW